MGYLCHLCLYARSRWLLGIFVDSYFLNHTRESGWAESHASQL